MSPIKLGRFKMFPIVASRFRLDGGSMFGVVPKVLWGKKANADKLNRIVVNLNAILVETDSARILIESGMGQLSKRDREIFCSEEKEIGMALIENGFDPHSIDFVILTHLHFDHAGGCTTFSDNGEIVPVFPRAKHIIQGSEWNASVKPHPLVMGSYKTQELLSLESSGLVMIINGGYEVLPGIKIEKTGGHSPGHQVVWIESDGKVALYPGDLVPMAAHLRLRWISSWDLEPLRVYAEKERILERCVRDDAIVFFPHDPSIIGCRIKEEGEYSFFPLEDSIIFAGS